MPKTQRPGVGIAGPLKEGFEQEPGSFSELAARKQCDRHDPVTVIINGEPVAKGRPRMTRRGFVYTPAATRKFEAHGRLSAQLAMDGRPPIDVPVRIELLVELPVPALWSRRKTADAITGHIRPTSRPDVDNYRKQSSTRSTRSWSPTTPKSSRSMPRKNSASRRK